MTNLDGITDELSELVGFAEMVKTRQPGLADRIDEQLARVAAEIEETFRPYTDLAEGRITSEEFFAIIEAREAADIARREAEYGDEPPWYVVCVDCGEEFESDELPSMYPQHSDIGIICTPIGEDDD